MDQNRNPYYDRFYNQQQPYVRDAEAREAVYRGIISRAFLYMVAALAITAVAAYTSADLLAVWLISGRFNFYLLFIAEIAVVIASNWAIRRNNVILAGILFTVYSFINGATIGILFWAYTEESISASFFMAAGMFGVMAVYGMLTKKDLSSLGSLCLMGLIGVLIAGIVNTLFLRSGMMGFAVSVIAILVFVGLTAYDTQKLKRRAAMADGERMEVVALMGAFELYLDFINIFLRLLAIMGRRK